MGSKLKPGNFDCYANALPDEPMFVLLGRDRLAPPLTAIWAAIRAGNRTEARRIFSELVEGRLAAGYVFQPEPEKALEASDCAMTMVQWRKENNGKWRPSNAKTGE